MKLTPMLRPLALLATLSLQLAPAGDGSATAYLTRAQAVRTLILSQTVDIPAIRNAGQFPDIPKGAWFEPYMLYGERIKLVTPDDDGRLRPDASVTRAELLKMLAHTYGLPLDLPHSFADVPRGSWFASYAGAAERFRLFLSEEHPPRLEPQRAVTRGEAERIFRLLGGPKVRKGDIRIEQGVAEEQSEDKLALYSVISTRRQRVVLVDAPQPAPAHRAASAGGEPPSRAEVRATIFLLLNDIRAREGIPPLSPHPLLTDSAQAYASAMAQRGFFSHTAPEGTTLRERVAGTGYLQRSFTSSCNCVPGFALGENLARGQRTPQEAVAAWMKSPRHRAAILSRDYTDVGIGLRAGVWVLHFGGFLMPEGASSY